MPSEVFKIIWLLIFNKSVNNSDNKKVRNEWMIIHWRGCEGSEYGLTGGIILLFTWND
jgi:hypothetical protein